MSAESLGPELEARLSEDEKKVLLEWNARSIKDVSPVAVGVEDRVGAIAELLASGRSVVLVGPKGVGKTVMAREAVRRLLARGQIDCPFI